MDECLISQLIMDPRVNTSDRETNFRYHGSAIPTFTYWQWGDIPTLQVLKQQKFSNSRISRCSEKQRIVKNLLIWHVWNYRQSLSVHIQPYHGWMDTSGSNNNHQIVLITFLINLFVKLFLQQLILVTLKTMNFKKTFYSR